MAEEEEGGQRSGIEAAPKSAICGLFLSLTYSVRVSVAMFSSTSLTAAGSTEACWVILRERRELLESGFFDPESC